MLERHEAEQLTDEERNLHQNHLSVIDIVDFAKLLKIGRYESFSPGSEVVTQGKPNRCVRLVMRGELNVYHDGKPTYILQPGNFISESGLHLGLRIIGSVEAPATVVALSPDTAPKHTKGNKSVVTIAWDRAELINLLEKESNLSKTFQSALNFDIVSKLERQKRHIDSAVGSEEGVSEEHLLAEERYINILKHRTTHAKISEHDRNEMFQYRTIHGIDNDEHAEALKKCGWTVDEFERGQTKPSQPTPSTTLLSKWYRFLTPNFNLKEQDDMSHESEST